jgi:ATP synthase protein I
MRWPRNSQKFKRTYLLCDRDPMSFTGDGEQGGRKTPQESSERLKQRLRELEQKLDTGNDGREGMSEDERGRRSSALGKALRLSTELVAGVFVGGFVGWLLDRWLKTLPLFLVVFLLLGIAAGLLNAVREARKMGEK